MLNVTKENLKEVLELLDVTPRFTDVIVSTNTNEDEFSNIEMSSRQFILAVGPNVVGLSVGDEVVVDIKQCFRRELVDRDANQYNFVLDIFPVEIGSDYLGNLISDRLIKLTVN